MLLLFCRLLVFTYLHCFPHLEVRLVAVASSRWSVPRNEDKEENYEYWSRCYARVALLQGASWDSLSSFFQRKLETFPTVYRHVHLPIDSRVYFVLLLMALSFDYWKRTLRFKIWIDPICVHWTSTRNPTTGIGFDVGRRSSQPLGPIDIVGSDLNDRRRSVAFNLRTYYRRHVYVQSAVESRERES